MEQAPASEVLKRKRSRPSDWWANGSIILSTPQRVNVPSIQQDVPEPGPAKKRGRPLNTGPSESLVRDAPAAGNRGRPAKKRQAEGDANDQNGGADGIASEKSARRGRSSGGAVELQVTAGPARDESGAGSTKKKRGRKPAGQAKDDEVVAENSEPKRRGRPTTAQIEQEETVGPVEPVREQNPLRKRGRPSLKESEVRAAVNEEESHVIEPKKRGRRPAADKTAQLSNEQEPETQDKPKKRGRQPVEATAEDIEELVVATAPRRSQRSDINLSRQDPIFSKIEESKRGRQRIRRLDVESIPESSASQVLVREERGRRRTRLSDVQSQQDLVSSIIESTKGKIQKANRRSSTTTNVESASSKLTKAPVRSHRVSRTADKATARKNSEQAKQRRQPSSLNAEQPTSTQLHKKKSGQKSNAESSGKRKEIERPESTPAKRRRLSKGTSRETLNVQEPEPEEPSMLYQHLQPVARKVSRQIIAAKWEPLPPACGDKISRLLQDVQRSVIAHLGDERKKTQASTAIQMVSRRLVSKISKGLPFPPATRSHREEDFDFEKVLDYNRALEAQLTPALHGNELLEAELAKEAARLEADKETLAELEKNAKSEASTRNSAARKLHALLQQPEELQGSNTALKDDIGMDEKGHHLLPLTLGTDAKLQVLIKGLHGHVDTINGNMNQVHGISEAIIKSKAAIQGTIFDHLSDVQYEEVILGSD